MPDSAIPWSRLESRQTPMHQGVLMIFRKPRGAGAGFVADLARELRAESAVGEAWKRGRGLLQGRDWLRPPWQDEAGVEMEYHFRHSGLPAPGGERELGELISRLHGHALDPGRPGWEIHLIEGLQRGRFAVYAKLGPELLREVDAVLRMTDWLSTGAAEQALTPPWAARREDAASGTADAVGAEAEAPGAAEDAREQARRLRRALRRLAGSAVRGGSLRAPYRAPLSALNVRVGTQRRFATQQYRLDRLQALAAACAVDLEVLVLYLCGSVLRRFFREYNALPEAPLLAACLGSGCLSSEPAAVQGGDAALSLTALGTQHADLDKRLAAVRDSVAASRAQRALVDGAAARYNALLTLPLMANRLPVAGRVLPPLANLPLAAVAGPARPRYLRGARLQALYPIFPLLQDHALSISLCTYAGTLNVGFHGEREALPHLQRMAVYMGVALETLEAHVAERSAVDNVVESADA